MAAIVRFRNLILERLLHLLENGALELLNILVQKKMFLDPLAVYNTTLLLLEIFKSNDSVLYITFLEISFLTGLKNEFFKSGLSDLLVLNL